MFELRTFKTVSLALAIVLGLVAQSITTPVQKTDSLASASGCFGCADAESETATGVVLAHFSPNSDVKSHPAVGAACGRDARIKGMWGPDAPFVSG